MIITLWPASSSCSAMNRPTLPPPAITTRMSVTSLGRTDEMGVELADGVARGGEVDDVGLLQDGAGLRHRRGAVPPDRDDLGDAGDLQLLDGMAAPRAGHDPLDQDDLGAR